MQRVTAVAVQVSTFGAGEDEYVQPGGADDRAHRVDPGTAVTAHRCGEAQADVVLVELRAAGCGWVTSAASRTPGPYA
ncbi:MAG TPA: hypothetical protein VKV38_15805 [Trebonia sp.]|nr:hypothetical protein [Trebonia sp.]